MAALTFAVLRNLTLLGGGGALDLHSLVDCGGGVQIVGRAFSVDVVRTTDAWVATAVVTQTWPGYDRIKLHRTATGRLLALVSGNGMGVEVHRSDDTGVTWALCQILVAAASDLVNQGNQPWPATTSGFLGVMVHGTFAGVDLTQFFTSADDGVTWVQAAATIGGGGVTNGQLTLSLETLSATEALVGTARFDAPDSQVHIYRTVDAFASIASLFAATTGAVVSLLTLDAGAVLAGRRQQSGVLGPTILGSVDSGATWAQLANLTALLGLAGEPTILQRLSSGLVGLGGQLVPPSVAIAATSPDGGVTWTRDTAPFALNASSVLTSLIRADDGLMYGGGFNAPIIYGAPWPFVSATPAAHFRSRSHAHLGALAVSGAAHGVRPPGAP